MIQNVRLDRRDALALCTMGMGLTAFVAIANRLRGHTRELTSDQRNHLSEIAKEPLEWSKVSDSTKNGELFVTRRDSGETVTVGYMRGQRSKNYEVRVTHGENDFVYRCPCHVMKSQDRKILKTLLASSSKTSI